MAEVTNSYLGNLVHLDETSGKLEEQVIALGTVTEEFLGADEAVQLTIVRSGGTITIHHVVKSDRLSVRHRQAIMEMEMCDGALQFMNTARYALHTDVNHFPREDGSAECIIDIGNAHGEGLSLTVIDGSD